jgi:hypothetical protein
MTSLPSGLNTRADKYCAHNDEFSFSPVGSQTSVRNDCLCGIMFSFAELARTLV